MAARPALDVLASAVGLLAGLAVAFSGYRLARSLAGLAGFLSGLVLGLVLGLVGGPVGSLVVGLLLGVLFAILFVMAFRLVGAALGASFGVALALALAWPAWGVALAGVAGGLVGLAANRVVIALVTALGGAWLAARSAMELLGDAGVVLPWDARIVLLVATLAVGALGLAAQVRDLRARPD